MLTAPLFTTERGDWSPTSDDHYTPGWIFETMGLEFDLDVASPPGGVPWIPAKRFYTIHDDGLTQPWEGLVWCNPPFSRVTPWADKWGQHPDGVFLACVSRAAWPARLFRVSEVVWFTERTFNFVAPEDSPEKHIPFQVFVAGRGLGAKGVSRLATTGGALLSPV